MLHSAHVFVQPDGMMYMTDFNAGLYIMEWIGEIHWSMTLRCMTSVSLENFPSPTHSKVLVGRDQGFDECRVSFSRVAAGDALLEPHPTAFIALYSCAPAN